MQEVQIPLLGSREKEKREGTEVGAGRGLSVDLEVGREAVTGSRGPWAGNRCHVWASGMMKLLQNGEQGEVRPQPPVPFPIILSGPSSPRISQKTAVCQAADNVAARLVRPHPPGVCVYVRERDGEVGEVEKDRSLPP